MVPMMTLIDGRSVPVFELINNTRDRRFLLTNQDGYAVGWYGASAAVPARMPNARHQRITKGIVISCSCRRRPNRCVAWASVPKRRPRTIIRQRQRPRLRLWSVAGMQRFFSIVSIAASPWRGRIS